MAIFGQPRTSSARRLRARQLVLVAGIALATVGVGCESSQKQIDAGVSAIKSGDYDRALTILVPLAKGGQSRAAVELGNMYALGWGVPVDDGLADGWFQKAESGGVPPGRSQLDIAFTLAKGHGTKRDPARAQVWLQKSASLGYDKATALMANADELKRKGFTGEESNGQ